MFDFTPVHGQGSPKISYHPFSDDGVLDHPLSASRVPNYWRAQILADLDAAEADPEHHINYSCVL
jgi:hypothetical protein